MTKEHGHDGDREPGLRYVPAEKHEDALHERRPEGEFPAVSDLPIQPGDYYEDCRYHPMLCVVADHEEDELRGISLVLGGSLASCSPTHCGVRKLSFEEAVAIAHTGTNWAACYYCGHAQVFHRDLARGGCDHPEGCDCAHVWSAKTRVW